MFLKSVTLGYDMKKTVVIFLIFNLLLFSFIAFIPCFNQVASGSDIYVDLNGGKDYKSIQEAVDNASDEDTIYVYSGVYYENIYINKSVDLFKIGEGNTIIDGGMNDYAIYVYANNVTIQNFNIKNAKAGIQLKDSSYTIVRGNTITQTECAITIDNSWSNTIYSNYFVNNTKNAYDPYVNSWYDIHSAYGNYWDDYTGTDSNGDGLGDTSYQINGGSNQDIYPLGYFHPIAKFTFSPEKPTDIDYIQFNDTSKDPDGFITKYEWDFGDGNKSNLQNPTHKFEDDDIYIVSLNVTDDFGLYNVKTQSIQVLNVPPVANFYYIPNVPIQNRNITFYDDSNDTDGYIKSWIWEFGDGEKSDDKDPTHCYDDGTYNVKLTVKDDDQAEKTISQVIHIINKKPEARFIIIPNEPSIEDTIKFTDSSIDYDGNIVTWSWDLGDGTTSDEKSPAHKYDEGRTYKVRLTVTDEDGDYDTIIRDIAVWDLTEKTQDYNGFIIVFIVFVVLFSVMIYFVIWIRKKEK